jgi:hypothetical protein
LRSKTNDASSPKGRAIEAASRFAQVRAAHVWQMRSAEEIAAREKMKEVQNADISAPSTTAMK